jgi:hypothetical protein
MPVTADPKCIQKELDKNCIGAGFGAIGVPAIWVPASTLGVRHV